MFIEAVSSSTSGRLGGRGARQVLWYFVFLCSSNITGCHQIVGLITGGLEWSSGEINIMHSQWLVHYHYYEKTYSYVSSENLESSNTVAVGTSTASFLCTEIKRRFGRVMYCYEATCLFSAEME